MAERSLYYWSKMYAEQLGKGERYKKLKKTIAINLLNFYYLTDEKDWHNIYMLLNTKSYRKLTDHMEIHFAEIPKFKLKDIRKMRASETWIAYFSGNYDDKELEELSMNKPIMKEVMDFERSFLMDKIQRREYEQREKALRDYYSYMGESYEQGEEDKAKEIALNLLRLGANIEMIVEATGLSENEIKNLQVTKE